MIVIAKWLFTQSFLPPLSPRVIEGLLFRRRRRTFTDLRRLPLSVTPLLGNMEFVNRIVDAAKRGTSNNKLINVCLGASFVTLYVRSMNQQKVIDSLEAEKESLVKSNKAMKKTMWDWKQQLYAEASSDSPLVPLARIKAIYGDATDPQNSTVGKTDANGRRFLI
ncbi:hypothetical protein L6164_012986 [Bauhinia variegata]|uniref:Uncharacterized protein n=1 Tax=Bauhinia variegata TaxID=167791 RepID=A0ACB9PBP6_BAUVA|nr:hypothetical protein L6164_012986 [Bauhinia variegata]